MRGIQAVVIDVLHALAHQQCMHFHGMAAPVRSRNRLAPVPFSRQDQTRRFLEMSLLPGDEQVRTKGIQLFHGAVDSLCNLLYL